MRAWWQEETVYINKSLSLSLYTNIYIHIYVDGKEDERNDEDAHQNEADECLGTRSDSIKKQQKNLFLSISLSIYTYMYIYIQSDVDGK